MTAAAGAPFALQPSLLAMDAAERSAAPSAPAELHWALGRNFASATMSVTKVAMSRAASPVQRYLASEPGMVLTSFTHQEPASSTRKSTRHTPLACSRRATLAA